MSKPTNTEQVAAQRGYPATLMGYTPNNDHYWREPGLPWVPLTREDYLAARNRRDEAKIWQFAEFRTEAMAPRFPSGTLVAIDPVHVLAELEVGRVYLHVYRHPDGTESCQVGRLEKIGGNALWLTQDNDPTGLIWPFREAPGEETWDVYEITHYAQYPAL